MFNFTFVQKLMLLGLGTMYLWFFAWIWRSGPTNWNPKKWSLKLKRQKESHESLGYTPSEGYFDKIENVKRRFGRWSK